MHEKIVSPLHTDEIYTDEKIRYTQMRNEIHRDEKMRYTQMRRSYLLYTQTVYLKTSK